MRTGTTSRVGTLPKSVLQKATVAVAFFMLLAAQSFAQATYYSKASATDFSNPSSWGPNADGSGIPPASITAADNYVVQNNSNISL